MHAEDGAEQPVAGRGRPAALSVAKDGHARLRAGKLVDAPTEEMADPAKALRAVGFADDHRFAAFRLHPLGDDDKGEVAPLLADRFDLARDVVQ